MSKFYLFVLFILSSTVYGYSNSCSMDIQGERWVCSGEATVLTAADGFSEYYWSNGQSGQSITATPGAYRVVGQMADGCIGTAEFSVEEIKLPPVYDLKILGASRVGDSQWLGSYYLVSPYNEQLDYIWTVNGDIVGHGRELEMENLSIGEYQLGVTAFNPCTGQSVDRSVPLVPYEGSTDSTTIYSCSMAPPYHYLSVPLPEAGLYDIIAVNQGGFQVAVRRHLIIEAQSSTYNDTLTLCSSEPVEYAGILIAQPGSYTIPVLNSFGCREQVYLEVLGSLEQPPSLETLVHCGGGGFEYNGEYYNSPGLYERIYSTDNGCDSLAYTFVEYRDDLPASDLFVEICSGDMYHHDGVSYSEAGVYTRTYPLTGGCDSIVIIHLSFQEYLQEEINYYFCNGGSILINGTVVTESGTLEYSIPSQSSGCDSLVIAHVQELNPIEVANQVLTPDDGNGAGSIALLIQGGLPPYSFEWSNGAETRDIEQLPAGTYSLNVTDGLGCTASFTFDLGLLSSLASQEVGYQLTLGPNPFRDKLRVFEATNRSIPDLVAYLYDATGRLAVRASFSGGFASIPPSLPQGLYWYRLEGNGKLLSTGKIIKQ